MVSTKSMHDPDHFVGPAYEGLNLSEHEKVQYSSVLIVRSYEPSCLYDSNSHHPIQVSDCPKCASNLPISETDYNGVCKCKYCDKEVYVW